MIDGDGVRFTMTRAAMPNTTVLRRSLRKLRSEDRLDEIADILATLLETSAKLVDEATGPSSDVAGYARARILQAHGQLLGQLRELVAPGDGRSPVDEFLRSLTVPGFGMADGSDDGGR
jgi:hypothetical protein